ncbi:MAG: SusC/RagA family TonB-linked outer membrane protein [Chitinophagaceae bacterium]
MRRFTKLLLLCILLLPCALSYAQGQPIKGIVVDEDNNAPIVGVTVSVKGTTRASQTDGAGAFTIVAKKGDVLQFSYVGYARKDFTVGDATTVSIRMRNSDKQLGEVVVTAMDIKRNPRELGYSVQKVDGKEIAQTQRENFINSLQGRVAGLTITPSSGLAGSSSSIVLRGFNSLSMSNQPLFIVDGVIMDNSTVDENSDGGKGIGMVDRTGLTSNANRNTDYTNRMADLNPNDIESITVLKGPEATALYGSQASSGAIVISTRKAKSNKLALQYDNSFRFQKITRYPDVYDQYSNGSNGAASNIFRYFGPKYDQNTVLYDNKDNFFKTGFTQSHNLGADFGFKKSIFRVSGSTFNQDGVVPNNTAKRYTLRISNTTKIGKYVDVTPSFTYINSQNRKVLNSAGGFLLGLLLWPSTNDIRNYADDNGAKIPLFSANPNSDYDNPLFNVNYNKNYDETKRYTGTLGININPFDWLQVSGRFGFERYNTYGYLQYHPNSYYISSGVKGTQDNFWRRYTGYNHTITATARKNFGKNFTTRLMVGTMWQDYNTQQFAMTGNTLVDVNRTDSNNTDPTSRQRLLRNNYGDYNDYRLRQQAYFGEASIGFKNVAFLSYTHRFESASTLPKKNRNYNYPGASLSLIVSDMIPQLRQSTFLSYWKLRGSIASTARLNSPYSTQSVFVNSYASGGGYSYGFTNANPDLSPEKQQTFEIGTEMRLFNSRINLDVAYYNTLNKDQIVENFRLSYGTGYVLNTQNAGSTRNQGVEVVLNASVLKTPSFGWDMTFNFAKMWNKVIKLPANVAEYYIADTWVYANARGGLTLNSATTTITSYGYSRNNNGDILINPTTGLPVIDATFKVHGDRNPNFTLGWNNSLRYKNWRLSFLWDLKVGGDVFNGTKMFMTSIGKSTLTADRMTPRVIKGVLNDGKQNTATPTQNNIVVVPGLNDDYYTASYMPEEAFIEKNVNWFRLRDITLSYTFPETLTRKVKFVKNLGVFATGNDLILITNYSGADPSANGNTAGTRGVGAFGFDYGKLPTPISVNVGLRATF